MINNTDEMLNEVIEKGGSLCTPNTKHLDFLEQLVRDGILIRGDSLGNFTNDGYTYFLNDNQNVTRLKEWL